MRLSQSCFVMFKYLYLFLGFVMFKYLYLFLGFGVFAMKRFKKGDFIVQYVGDLVDSVEAAKREKLYEQSGYGSFLYFFAKYW